MKSLAREVAETVILAALLFLMVRSLVQTYRVEQQSMEPTLHEGQYLVVLKVAYGALDDMLAGRAAAAETSARASDLIGSPGRGDIVVFDHREGVIRHLVKRVIALPGETIEVRDGAVWVDGHPLDEPYVTVRATYTMAPQTVPAGFYFVLGDNRNVSNDSHLFGPVPRDTIIGRAYPLPYLGGLVPRALVVGLAPAW